MKNNIINKVYKIEATESLLKIHFFQLYSINKQYAYPIIDEIGINEKYPGLLETFNFSKVKLEDLFEFIDYRKKWGINDNDFLIPSYFYYVWNGYNLFYPKESDWINVTKMTNDKYILSIPHPTLFTEYILSSNNDLIAVNLYNLILILNKKDEILFHFDKSDHECDCRLTFLNEEYIAIEMQYFEDHRGDETLLLKYTNGKITEVFEVNSIELFDLIINNGIRLRICHLSDELKSDKKIVLKILGEHWHYIDTGVIDLNQALLNDKDFILNIVIINTDYLDYASENLKNDKIFMIEAVKNNGNALEYASELLKADREVVLSAVKNNANSFRYCSEFFLNDEDFILEAFGINPKIKSFIDPKTLKKHKRLQEFFKEVEPRKERDAFDGLPF